MRALIAVVRVTPAVVVRGAGTLLGLAFYTIDGPHRRIAARNLATAFPSRPEAERRAIARAAFAHFGRLLFELLQFSTLSREQMLARVEFDGEERSRLAYAQGKGVLFITGHFGFWELQAMVHAVRVAAGHNPGARARQSAAESSARGHPAEHRQHRGLPARHHPPRDADAAGRPRRRGADRSAHHEPRRDLRRLLRAAGGDDLRGRGAGLAHRRAGRAGVRAAARARALPSDLRAPGRAAAGRLARRGPRVHAALHRCARDMAVRRHPELWLWMHRRGATTWSGGNGEGAKGMFPSAERDVDGVAEDPTEISNFIHGLHGLHGLGDRDVRAGRVAAGHGEAQTATEPQEPTGLHSRRLRLNARGCAAAPDVMRFTAGQRDRREHRGQVAGAADW